MTIETYPSTPVPSYTYTMDHQFRTVVSDFESGAEQRRLMWRFPKRTFLLLYKAVAMTDAERYVLYKFFQQRSGSYESFYFFDFTMRRFFDQYVGYGDGSTATFDLPSKTTTNDATLKVYVAGVEKTITVDFNFVSGGGGGGSDRITFIAGHIPALGALITVDFNGYLRIKGRFKDDKLTEELFTVDYETISVSIYEVK